MDSVYALRALAVSAIISVVLAFAHVGLVKSVKGGVHSQEWSTVGRSKMERHEQYVWMVSGEHMSWRRKTSLDGSLHFLSFPTAHSEGGLGIGMRGSGWVLLHVRAFGWVSRLALASFISQLVWSKAFTGGTFASADRSPVMFA